MASRQRCHLVAEDRKEWLTLAAAFTADSASAIDSRPPNSALVAAAASSTSDWAAPRSKPRATRRSAAARRANSW